MEFVYVWRCIIINRLSSMPVKKDFFVFSFKIEEFL